MGNFAAIMFFPQGSFLLATSATVSRVSRVITSDETKQQKQRSGPEHSPSGRALAKHLVSWRWIPSTPEPCQE